MLIFSIYSLLLSFEWVISFLKLKYFGNIYKDLLYMRIYAILIE